MAFIRESKTALGYHRHGSPYKGGRYGSLGGVQEGKTGKGADFAGVMMQQRNEAGRVFGPTAFNQPGRTDIFYPNVSGDYALKLLKYWRREGERVKKKFDSGLIPPFPSAVSQQWKRALSAMNSAAARLITFNAEQAGKGLILQANAKRLWDMIDGVVLPMRGVEETPTSWELLKESFEERLKELGVLDFLGKLKWVAIAGVAYIGWNEFQKRKRA